MVTLVITLERGAAQPRPFFSGSSPLPLPMRTRLCMLWVQLSTFALLHNGSWCSMDDNFFENAVLFTQYMTLNFSIFVLLSPWFEWMPQLLKCCCQWRKSSVWQRQCVVILPLLLEYYEAKIQWHIGLLELLLELLRKMKTPTIPIKPGNLIRKPYCTYIYQRYIKTILWITYLSQYLLSLWSSDNPSTCCFP